MTQGSSLPLACARIAVLLGLGLAITGCGEDVQTSLVSGADTMVLTVDGTTTTFVEASDTVSTLGYDPIIVAGKVTANPAGVYTAGAMARIWDDGRMDYSELAIFQVLGDQAGTYSSNSGVAEILYFQSGVSGGTQSQYKANVGTPGSTGTVTINEYGAEGELVTGSFQGTLLDEATQTLSLSLSATFSITREADNWPGFTDGGGGGGGGTCIDQGTPLIHMETIRDGSAGPYADTVLELLDASGTSICVNDNGVNPPFSELQAHLTQGATYYLRVTSPSGTIGPYSVRATNTGGFIGGAGPAAATNDPDEPTNGTLATPAVLSLPSPSLPLSRKTDSSTDEDWFKFVVP